MHIFTGTIRRCRVLAIGYVGIFGAFPGLVFGQSNVERSYVDDPTVGLHVPVNPIAGEYDSLSVLSNPAGIALMSGGELGAVVDVAHDATRLGRGVGFVAAKPLGGALLPGFGLGMGIEFLRHPQGEVVPDRGKPVRFTTSLAMGLGQAVSIGASWHRFHGDEALKSLNSVELGAALRMGAYMAAGLVVRDVNTPAVLGTSVQRRYEGELAFRPFGSEAVEVGAGGRVGERDRDLDTWFRWSVRLFRGVFLRGQLSTASRRVLETTGGAEAVETKQREYQASLGLELSFGRVHAASYATGTRGAGETRFRGATLIGRYGQRPTPPVFQGTKRIELVKLEGTVSSKQHTSLIARLRSLRDNGEVRAILLRLDGYRTGWATAQELRDEIRALRRSGKPVFVHAVVASSREYFFASAADRVYIDPAGGLRLAGLSATLLYFKGLLSNLGIEAQFEKIEEFKSAPEAYTQTGPSDKADWARNQLFDSIDAELVRGIARSRGISRNRLRTLIDEGPYSAGDLRAQKQLVDAVVTFDDALKRIARYLGGRYPVSTAPQYRPNRWGYPGVAVIHVEGDIVDGKSRTIPVIGKRLVGSETIARAIVAARTDPRVNAIVLRIDTPGGSAVASELMAREVFKTRGVKPIICSLGNIAASGGYFAAAGCDVIFADPMTITGSIGIFYGKFDLSRLLDRLGVSRRTYKRGNRADTESWFRSYTQEERKFVKSKLRYLYGRFVRVVADGRKMTQAQVHKVGRGRVWTGVQARPIGLVDRFGGVGDAIALAKVRAGLKQSERVRIALLPQRPRGLLNQLLKAVGLNKSKRDAMETWSVVEGARHLFPGSLLDSPQQAQARLPFAIVWD